MCANFDAPRVAPDSSMRWTLAPSAELNIVVSEDNKVTVAAGGIILARFAGSEMQVEVIRQDLGQGS